MAQRATRTRETPSREQVFLRNAAILYGVGLVLHLADHLRRGTVVLTGEVNLLGTISTVAGVVTIGLIMTRHRLAPVAAIALGFPVAVGVAAVHLLPRWSDFSDAFPGSTTGVNAMSWTVVLIEIAGAFALGLAGRAMLRRSSEPARSA
ncbi:MAG: hypothetical protein WEB06_20015 [Actinomycetota bacterium]